MNFRTLDLNLLRVFGAVMVERNVTRAAAQLAMTQPAVSNALRRLREATGDELFFTVPGGVLPTAQAEALWPDVLAALDGLRHAFDPQGFEPTRDERSFSLAMADATATVLMPALIGALVGRDARSALRVLPLASRDPRPQLDHGSTEIRSESWTTRAAVANWLTVRTTRRLRPSEASASSTKPRGRPAKLTRTCSAAQ